MDKANRKVTFEQEAKIYEEAALAEIKKTIGDGSCEPPEIACILQSGRRAIYMARQELASRVEVVYGEWIVCGDGDNVPWMCSHCGKTTAHKYKTMYGKYCPNCGAKMDGDGDG